jgi:hypothetical protein
MATAGRKIEKIDAQTVRVWSSYHVAAKPGQFYLLRHYTFEEHAIVMASNQHLSLQYVTIFSFPGIGFILGGDQHHFELLQCRIGFPENERRPITVTADGFHVDQSQGFIKLMECDFGYMGDDCINIHDNIHSGGGAAVAMSAINNGDTTHYSLLENILFENNLFKEMPGPAIQATSFKNLVIRNNSFINLAKPRLL